MGLGDSFMAGIGPGVAAGVGAAIPVPSVKPGGMSFTAGGAISVARPMVVSVGSSVNVSVAAGADASVYMSRNGGNSSSRCGEKGEYRDVGGHHVHAKSAFKFNPDYDPEQGFSISQEYMESRGWDHQAMTNKQRELFNELARSGRPNTLQAQSAIARQALIAGGATPAQAQALVQESLENLSAQGITAPSGIPWNQ
jgi:hypothetical protein